MRLRCSLRSLLFLSLVPSIGASEGKRVRVERTENGSVITAHGTVFAIGKRQALTAAHNVSGPHETISIELAPGRWVPATVEASDTELDVALLSTVDDLPDIQQLADEDPKQSDVVRISGSMRGTAIADFEGRVTASFWKGTARILARVAFDHGLSGSPVISKGSVVAMAVAGVPKDADLDKEFGLLLPVTAIRAFLEREK